MTVKDKKALKEEVDKFRDELDSWLTQVCRPFINDMRPDLYEKFEQFEKQLKIN